MFAALKARHAYRRATDNNVLDFQAVYWGRGGQHHIMGDIVNSQQAPKLLIRAVGT